MTITYEAKLKNDKSIKLHYFLGHGWRNWIKKTQRKSLVLQEPSWEYLAQVTYFLACKHLLMNVSSSNRTIYVPQFFKIFSTIGYKIIFFFRIGQPFCLSQLINYFNEDSDISLEFAYLYASGVVLGSALTAFNYHSRCFKSQYIATRVRVATCSLVFRKA